ncbi:MAG: hypothetical protein WA364_12790 [Candidatus Nitrosopolaris sp.]
MNDKIAVAKLFVDPQHQIRSQGRGYKVIYNTRIKLDNRFGNGGSTINRIIYKGGLT